MKYANKHDEIVRLCQTAITFVEVEANLGLVSPNTSLRRYIKHHKIEMPYYLGQRHGIEICRRKAVTCLTESHLCQNSDKTTGSIKKYLLRNGLKEPKCESCGWAERRQSDNKCPVQLHHRNGDNSDNRLENLQMLCPNCHSLTENYCGKNMGNSPRSKKSHKARIQYYVRPKVACEICGKLGYGEKYCSYDCLHMAQRKVERPTKEALAEEIATYSWCALGRKYGVSDNAVRKWAESYGLAL